jgi:hypothetical protein
MLDVWVWVWENVECFRTSDLTVNFAASDNITKLSVKIMMNNREVVIFSGATVADAVRAYSRRSAKLLENGKFRVFDQYGNRTEADGELTDGQKLYLKRRDHEEV